MKRYFCTAAAGLLLAFGSAGTASATGLPELGGTQEATQSVSFGDQTVGEQKNDADVTQAQGNHNLNIVPAVGILGDAETTNAQGNGNTATADVDQSNSVDQSQSSYQRQSLEQGGSGECCDSVSSQTGAQHIDGGTQYLDKQSNDADVTQAQGNGNINVAPAIAVFGDAETTNYQGNGNTADASVTQSNDVTQSQSATQKQDLSQQGDACCEPMEKTRYGKPERSSKDECCDGQSQAGEQKTSFGDQTVGKQRNDADVTQKQGNGNINVAPAIAIFGDAETKNKQGNGNTATADVDQSNSVDQSQSSYQRQSLGQSGGRGEDSCCDGQSQAGAQHVYGGDQTVDKQRNDADVDQYQGNGNVNVAPAIAVFGDAKTENYQGNHNRADADVTQSNSATQSQSATQKQYLSRAGSECCKSSYDDKPKHDGDRKDECCDGQSQAGEQKTSFGDQTVGKQRNDADVTQKQGNGNVNFSPALGIGGKKQDGCQSKCDRYGHGGGDASTWNAQGNGSSATADVDQSNSVEQSQRAYQYQRLVDACEEVMAR